MQIFSISLFPLASLALLSVTALHQPHDWDQGRILPRANDITFDTVHEFWKGWEAANGHDKISPDSLAYQMQQALYGVVPVSLTGSPYFEGEKFWHGPENHQGGRLPQGTGRERHSINSPYTPANQIIQPQVTYQSFQNPTPGEQIPAHSNRQTAQLTVEGIKAINKRVIMRLLQDPSIASSLMWIGDGLYNTMRRYNWKCKVQGWIVVEITTGRGCKLHLYMAWEKIILPKEGGTAKCNGRLIDGTNQRAVPPDDDGPIKCFIYAGNLAKKK